MSESEMRKKVRKYVEIRMHQGFDAGEIRARLARRGVAAALIEETIQEVTDDIARGKAPQVYADNEVFTSASINSVPAGAPPASRHVTVAKQFVVIGEDGHSEIQDHLVDEEVVDREEAEGSPSTVTVQAVAPRVELPPPVEKKPAPPQFHVLRLCCRVALLGILALHGWKIYRGWLR